MKMKNRVNRNAVAILLILSMISVIFFAGIKCRAEAAEETGGINYSAEDMEKKIYELIEENKNITPSVSIRVFGQNEDICSVIYGYADVENNVLADEETIYEWGSISKLLVWVSAMQLYEEGSLELDKDIREYLPEGFLKKLSFNEPITMIDLMNHTAGFQSPYKELETGNPHALMRLDEALMETAPAQVFAPGDVMAYSNWGAALVAYVVENVSGMDYADYVKKNIFERLGMNHTALKPDLSDNPWVAEKRNATHAYCITDGVLTSMEECRAYIHIYPAGSATGTVDDLKKFAQAFLCDSADTPLFSKPDTLDIMLTPTLYYADGKTPRSCHGLKTDIYGKILLGHGGNTTGFTSLLQFDRESKTGFVMMINMRGDRIYRANLPELIYGETDYSEYREDDFQKVDFSGHYLLSGGFCEKGCVSVGSLFIDRFLVEENNGVYTGSRGVESITQISDNAAIVRLFDGTENLYFIQTDENGNVMRLENSSLDFIKYSNFRHFLEIALVITFLLALGIMVFFLVINLIRLRKFKGTEERKRKRCEIYQGIAAGGLAIAISLIGIWGIEYEIIRTICCISATVFLVLMLAMLIRCFRYRRKGCINKVLILECVCCFFLTVGFIYWRVYQFWGF